MTVGSDCSVGKMTAMWQVWEQARTRGVNYGFVATGQTGILLTGAGIAIDRVISDFVAGAAEQYTVEAGAWTRPRSRRGAREFDASVLSAASLWGCCTGRSPTR